jgi:dienelactone hydrolase
VIRLSGFCLLGSVLLPSAGCVMPEPPRSVSFGEDPSSGQAKPSPPLMSTWNYSFVPDSHYEWHGADSAAPAYVWSHGKGPHPDSDNRGSKPPPHVGLFNDAGFDVIRFDRFPTADERERAAGWLREGVVELRRRGYRVIVTGGQSRGGWTSLQMIGTPGLVDAIIAVSPAAHGMGSSMNLLAQSDDLRRMLTKAPEQKTRVAFIQFQDDPYVGDADRRRDLLDRILRPKVGALLVIDRPEGFAGHDAGATPAFAERFGPCLLRFVTDPVPPASC